jgi:hypothetical protein
MDKSDTQAGQLVFVNGNPARTPAGVKNYALAPANARAAEWDAVPDLDRDDKFYQSSARGEYELADDVRLTAISAYQHFSLDASTDADGTSFQDYRGTQKGNIGSFYNEARLSGDSGHVKWVVGGSYQHDKTNDSLEAGSAQSSFPFTSNRAINQQRIPTYAGFANVDYEVLSGLTVQCRAESAIPTNGVHFRDALRMQVMEALQHFRVR